MEIVPWKYNDPKVDRSKLDKLQFLFRGSLVEIFQDMTKEIDVTKNTAFKLWDGAYLLARFISEGKIIGYGDTWEGKKCIELGSGCGLVGIVSWMFGAHVTLTDLQEAITHLDHSVNANTKFILKSLDGLSPDNIKVRPLDWTQRADDDISGSSYDFILGSDVVYHPRLNLHLVNTLNALSGQNTTILISYKPRGLQEDNFFRLLDRHSFIYSVVDKNDHPAEFLGSDYQILMIKKNGK